VGREGDCAAAALFLRRDRGVCWERRQKSVVRFRVYDKLKDSFLDGQAKGKHRAGLSGGGGEGERRGIRRAGNRFGFGGGGAIGRAEKAADHADRGETRSQVEEETPEP